MPIPSCKCGGIDDGDVIIVDGDGDQLEVNPDGSINVCIDDCGNVIDVQGTVSVDNFPAEVEVSNDVGNPLPVSDAGGSLTVDDGDGSITVDGTVSASEAKAEDSVAADADLGIPILGVRNDTAATKTSADGDYSMIATDHAGRVGIADLGGSITVDGSVTTTPSASTTGANTSVVVSTVSITLLAANAARKGAILYNDGASGVLVRLGSPASTTDFAYSMNAGTTIEIPFSYTGIITAIRNAGSATVRVTELT